MDKVGVTWDAVSGGRYITSSSLPQPRGLHTDSRDGRRFLWWRRRGRQCSRPVANAESYKVYRDTSSTDTFSACITGCTTVRSQSSYLDVTASPGVYYWYRGAACSECLCCVPYSGCSGSWRPSGGSVASPLGIPAGNR